MKSREIGNLALHVGAGGAITALVMYHPLFIIFATFIYVSLREQAQHRLILIADRETLTTDGKKLFAVEKRTFFDFGWLGKRQMFEIAQWTIGAALVSIPWYFFG